MANILEVNFPVGSNQEDETVLIRIYREKAIIKSFMDAYQKTELLFISLAKFKNKIILTH